MQRILGALLLVALSGCGTVDPPPQRNAVAGSQIDGQIRAIEGVYGARIAREYVDPSADEPRTTHLNLPFRLFPAKLQDRIDRVEIVRDGSDGIVIRGLAGKEPLCTRRLRLYPGKGDYVGMLFARAGLVSTGSQQATGEGWGRFVFATTEDGNLQLGYTEVGYVSILVIPLPWDETSWYVLPRIDQTNEETTEPQPGATDNPGDAQ